MKKSICTFITIFALVISNAQEETKTFGFTKGNKIIEGNLSFNSSKNENTFNNGQSINVDNSNFSFSPKFGYFIQDKLAVGGYLNFGTSRNQNFNNSTLLVDDSKNQFTGGGLFARYYFLDLGKRFKTFTEVGIGFGTSKNELNNKEISSSNSFGLGVGLGINYFVTEKIAITFGLNDILSFNRSKTKFENGQETVSSNISGNLNTIQNIFNATSFGLMYKF